ncbi:hypothetical protein G1H11_21165 [Phytoactinopolyspora alkaliphila]|uniref:Acetylxylan esterase n=1 Tax=Phytoactinopolyspora alkaliphila TaxID=1783498 RepID=A0A6N9YS09_9ACTN|nr:alpha/beta hydrolase family protein [Phytoactinopolyspora alkaliphila]NED97813.1 hypothetical protein [Phytoactinopolyspora alkaliphila]
MTVNRFAPESVHERLLEAARPELAFDGAADLDTWRDALGKRLREVVGALPSPASLDVRVEWRVERDGFTETRFVFTAEPGADVPCHLLVPADAAEPVPVVVCLQGHTSGMHNSLGRADGFSLEPKTPEGDRDFAVQAVSRGYAALAMEQRCFGERSDRRPADRRHVDGPCHHASHVASLLGRTMVGERVWDVSRAIDALTESFGEVLDLSRIACLGNSGGGTVSWYAACLDPRISAVMPSCSICTYRACIGSIDHCSDNYLPGALRYFDMPDLAGLIAPRPLVVVAGRDDPLFPVAGVEEAFVTIQAVYDAAGAPDACELVIGDGGHRFYAADAWPVFARLAGWTAS